MKLETEKIKAENSWQAHFKQKTVRI